MAAAPGWTIYPSSKRSPGSRDGRGMLAKQDLFIGSSIKLGLQFTDSIWYISRPSKNETRVIRYSISTCPLAEFQHITWKGARQDYSLKNVWYVPPDKYIKAGPCREVNRQMGPTHMSDGNIHHFWMLISCGISHLRSSFTWQQATTHHYAYGTPYVGMSRVELLNCICSTSEMSWKPRGCVNRLRILHKMTLLIWQNTLFHSSQPATATGICGSTKVLSRIYPEYEKSWNTLETLMFHFS